MRRNARRRRRRHGFTLMEVLLVLTILVILGGMVGYYFTGMQKRAFVDAARTQIKPVKNALRMYHLDVGSYPSASQGLQSLVAPPADLRNPAKWRGPYLEEEVPLDPWDNPYQYETSNDQIRVWSLGPDGQDGTTDDVEG